MVSKKLGRLGHTFAGHLHVERHGVLVGVDLDAGQLGAVLVYVLLEVDDCRRIPFSVWRLEPDSPQALRRT